MMVEQIADNHIPFVILAFASFIAVGKINESILTNFKGSNLVRFIFFYIFAKTNNNNPLPCFSMDSTRRGMKIENGKPEPLCY